MEGLRVSFFLKASVLPSKDALMVYFPPLILILLLVLAPLESTLVSTIWHALSGFLKEPALAFLLLNCVTLTIFASSKLGSEKREHEEEGQGEAAWLLTEKGDEKEDDVVETVVGLSLYLDTPVEVCHQKGDDAVESVVKPSLHLPTPFKTGQDVYVKNKGGSFLRKSWSLSASFEYKTKDEQVRVSYVKEKVKEKKPIRSSGRLGSRRNEKLGLRPSKRLSTELQKEQLVSGSLTSSHDGADSERSHHDEKTALRDASCEKTVQEQRTEGCGGRSGGDPAGGATDQEPRQAGDPAPAAEAVDHPSMDEVWAAIMSSKKANDCMVCSMQAKKHRKKPISKTVKQPQPAAATSTSATYCTTAARAPPPAGEAATAATESCGSPCTKPLPNSAKKPPTSAAKKRVEDASCGRTTEVDELSQRADEFIGRFSRQLRLQREESLQQRQKMRGRRACNYDVHYGHQTHSPGLRAPPRGLLVGR